MQSPNSPQNRYFLIFLLVLLNNGIIFTHKCVIVFGKLQYEGKIQQRLWVIWMDRFFAYMFFSQWAKIYQQNKSAALFCLSIGNNKGYKNAEFSKDIPWYTLKGSDWRWCIKMWVFPYFEYPCMSTSPPNCQDLNAWCNIKRTSKQKTSIRW